MQTPYWEYFLALEDDLIRAGRYVEFDGQEKGVRFIFCLHAGAAGPGPVVLTASPGTPPTVVARVWPRTGEVAGSTWMLARRSIGSPAL